MLRPYSSQSVLFIRLVCLSLCCLLAAPLPALIPEPRQALAGETALTKFPTKTSNTPHQAIQTGQRLRWRDGELLVRFRQNASSTDVEALLQANGAQRAGRLKGQSGIERLRLSQRSDPAVVTSALQASHLVDLAEPNYLIAADEITPNDPRFTEQWPLKSADNAGGQLSSGINATQGWELTTGSKRTVIAIIDSGIDFTHPDLRSNQWQSLSEKVNNFDDDNDGFIDDLHGWDFITDANEIKDKQGHGTAIAGIVAARGNNAIGITGVMWRASLMSLRVLDNAGIGTVANAVEALDYAVTHGAQVINCSWGTDDSSTALLEAINRAARRGVLVIASAGNNSRDIEKTPHYPASYDLENLISVASTDSSDILATWSNYAATHPMVAAPGTDILTTKMGGDYQTVSGSSVSAAFVTGVAGLIKTLRPWLNADRTRAMLLQGVRQVPALAGKVASGGSVNAAGALNALSTLQPNEGLNSSNGNSGAEHSASRGNQSSDSNSAGNRSGNGIDYNVTPPAPTLGAPGMGLPNLDELRHQQPTNPKAPAPIPSTRCSPHNPRCDPSGRLSAIEAPIDLLAWGLNLPLTESPFGDNSGLTADTPFHLTLPSLHPPATMFPQPQTTRTNVALASNGAVASASSNYDAPGWHFTPSGANDGDRKGLNWGSGGGWNDAAPGNTFPDWLQIDFNGSKTIDEIDVFTEQDNYAKPSEPTEAMTFSLYGLTGYEVQYWNGTSWVTVSGASVTGNNKVWRKFTFLPVTTSKIRVLTNASVDGYSRLTEVEAWGTAATPNADFNNPRLDLNNRTGQSGVDLLSGNLNWSIPLLGLPGRAGLDLGLTLSYNSLVWTKSQDGTSIKFDADRGTPSPGFRLGFPVIQASYYNSQTGKNAYLLITPAGGRVELRQVGTSNIYEADDSSYLQLKEESNGNLTLKPTDGSQLTYRLYSNQYQCEQIKDRNGNYITISHHPDGRINTITDTLARNLYFNYDAYLNLRSIVQKWMVNGQEQTREWVTFGWSNIVVNTSFYGLTVSGPQNGTVIPALTQVGFTDGTRYNFEYNSYAQVSVVRHYAADNHQMSYTSYTFPAGSSDCPRPTEQKVWAEHWAGQNDVPAEVVTSYSFERGVWGQATMPDGTIYKELFATSGWQKGLTTGTEVWSGGIKKKWTTASWTQSDTSLLYQKNPRVTETNVYDSDGNRKRTVIEYGQYAEWGLPYRVIEYAADATTEIRHTFTDYNLSPEYVNRRIIGLVSARHLSDTLSWQAIVTYSYDDGGDQLIATSTATVQHDIKFNLSLTVGRGNLTKVTRYDVTDINNAAKRVETTIGYDTNGSVVFSRDAGNHKTKISYDDSFSDGVNHNTYAYPTTVTDPDTFSSTTQYNYQFGAVTRTEGPPPAGQTQGSIQTFEYDAAGRTTRVNNPVNGAYRRWVYDPYGALLSYTIVQAGLPEVFTINYFDGAGRPVAQGGDNPNSVGLYSGQYTYYDVMGRAFKQSNPTEMTSSWIPAGDDAAGWAWTQQAYDWKGRPTLTTNSDGTTKEVAYGGCGCAGGEVVTVRDEIGRKQRLTADILGRARKSEVLQQSGNEYVVYSTVTNNYNARDQVTSIVEQAGTSGASQTTILTYDGHGRLKTRQAPAQTAPTLYSYNADDMVQSVTDGRGVVTTFAYNNRHLATGIAYNPPTGIADSPSVTFGYDAAGNRTSMSDETGNIVTYSYDRLSRLTAETRQFNGLSGSYTLSYGYNLADELTSITDPMGAVVNYSYDKTGRMTDVTGSSFAGVTNYASNLRYRAWGAIKSASFGDNSSLAASYNSRLLPTDFTISGLISKHYEYNADGRLRYSQDKLANRFDRSYTYDHVGRVTAALSGPAARAEADTDNRPYMMYYEYDQMNHLTSHGGRLWSGPAQGDGGSYSNDRNIYWQYDADGRLTNSDETEYAYDAAGRAINVLGLEGELRQTQSFDGDGVRTQLSNQQVTHNLNGTTTTETKTQYFLTSSVIGAVVTELGEGGQKERTFVYQGNQILAWQQQNGSTQTVAWEHRDVSNATVRGAAVAELEPLGMNAGLINPFPRTSTRPPLVEDRTYPAFANAASNGPCRVDGIDTPCELAMSLLQRGAAAQCPNNDCGPQVVNGRLTPLGFDPNTGRLGYGHWEETGGGVDREWDGNDKSAAGSVIGTHRATRRFVVDAWAVTSRFDFLSHGPEPQDPLKPEPQDPRGAVNEAFRKARESQRAKERNNQANLAYQKCVMESPEYQEYEQAFNKANLRASIPLPGALGVGKLFSRTVNGVRQGQGLAEALLTRANIFSFFFGGIMNILISNPHVETQALFDKLNPMYERCWKQVKDTFGFEPKDPYYFNIRRYRH